MDLRKAETLYLQRRVADSVAMAAAATGPCAQTAHMTLARLYSEAIEALVAQPMPGSMATQEKEAASSSHPAVVRAGA